MHKSNSLLANTSIFFIITYIVFITNNKNFYEELATALIIQFPPRIAVVFRIVTKKSFGFQFVQLLVKKQQHQVYDTVVMNGRNSVRHFCQSAMTIFAINVIKVYFNITETFCKNHEYFFYFYPISVFSSGVYCGINKEDFLCISGVKTENYQTENEDENFAT